MGGWPWPLDAVQGWFESFWRGVTEGLNAIASQLTASVNSLTSSISAGLGALGDALRRALLDAVGALQAGLASLASGILTGLQGVQDVVVGAVSGAFAVVEDVLGDVADSILNGLKAIWDGLLVAFQVVWSWLSDNVFRPILDLIRGAFEAAADAIKGLARTFVDTVLAMAPHSPAGGLEASIVAFGLAAGFQIIAAGAATALDAVHPFHSLEVKQLVLSAFSATGISAIGPAVLSRIVDVALIKPAVQELNEMYVRELPGPSDLVRFVVREQISPEELELWLKRQGFGPKWSTAFWGSHWVVPSREEAVELFHRGAYTLQQVTDNLVLNDRKPDAIPDLLSLTFRTPSRAELERILEVADVAPDRLEAWLRADGVSDELLPVYRDLVRGRRLVRILTRVESMVRTEIRAGRLQVAEARALMSTFRFAPEVIEAELDVAKRERDLELREELQKIAVERFKKGEIEDRDLAQGLLELGFDQERVGTIVALEKLRKLPKPKAAPAPTG